MTWLVLISLIAVFSGWFIRRDLTWFWSYAGLCTLGLGWLLVASHQDVQAQLMALTYSLAAGMGAVVQCFRIIGAELRGQV
ncbi:MAG: hypothetical protein CMK09_17975 [Ponticaulis sp.]|nr:hypothetical protein [Ponticaulis sp.]